MRTPNLLAEKNRYQNTQLTTNINIPSGQNITSFVDCFGVRLAALLFPQNWTACNIAFYTSVEQNVDLTFTPFLKTNFDGSSLLIPTSPSQELSVVPGLFHSTKYFQIFCSANQAQNVSIIGVFEPLYQGIHA